jgi:hypothetical protein|nr:FixH family protein [uncultured Pseudoxanthomonas sp.]
MTTKPDSLAGTPRPFWKEPMVWLVWGLPLASVVAGIWLVVTAVRAGGADSVTDKVQRVSQIQTTDLGPDDNAAKRKLSAIVQIRTDHVEMIAVTGDFAGTSPLVLTLAHPTEAAKDVVLTLARDTASWTAPAEIETTHDWNIQLTPQDGTWRIRGRLQKDTQAVRLAPTRGTG